MKNWSGWWGALYSLVGACKNNVLVDCYHKSKDCDFREIVARQHRCEENFTK